MLLLLPILAFILTFRLFRRRALEWRCAILASGVVWTFLLVVITEGLSLFSLINRTAVALSWSFVCLGAVLLLARRGGQPGLASRQVNFRARDLDRGSRILLGGAGILGLLVGVTAVAAAPNTWDAMEYHLPRVVMWISNHSVRPFATPDYFQLIYGPCAEYVMMHLALLWGNDRFVNLVEFCAFLGAAVGASLIAKLLGARPRGQAISAIVCITIPQGLLEASGPMNMYVVSFWIVTTVYFILLWNVEPNWMTAVLAGLACGLALFTKGVAYIYIPPLLLFCWLMTPGRLKTLFLKRAVVILVLVIAINAPQWVRCYELTGSIVGTSVLNETPRTRIAVQHITPAGSAANILRNIALHVGTPSARVNTRLEQVFRKIIADLGVNPDDPGALYAGIPFSVHNFSLHEIHGGNPLHLALLLLAVVFTPIFRAGRTTILYSLAVVTAFLLFCTVIRWTEWSSRYHLVIFLLGAPLIGLFLERLRVQASGTAAALILLVFATPFAASNRIRSLVRWSSVTDIYHPRPLLYFTDQHERLAASHIAAARMVNETHCDKVAIDSYWPNPGVGLSPKSLFVYPLMALIQPDGYHRRVWYTGVHNSSARYSIQAPPCAVVCFECASAPEKLLQYGQAGTKTAVFGDTVVFTAPSGPLPPWFNPPSRRRERAL